MKYLIALLISLLTISADAATAVGSGSFSVSDFANQAAAPNIVTNSGFESAFSSWSSPDAYQSIDSTTFHGGAAAAKITIATNLTVTSSISHAVIPVVPGRTYHISVWLRKSTGTYYEGAYIYEQKANGDLATGSQFTVIDWIPAGVWYHAEKDLTASALTAQLYFYASLWQANGTFWIDDLSITDTSRQFTPLSGTYTGGNFSATTNNLLVTAQVTLNGGVTNIVGTVTNQAAGDRAIAIKYGIPFDANGWTWHDDTATTRTITGAAAFKYTTTTEAADGERSIYPLGTVTDANGNSLTIAFPMSSSPRVFVVQYDNIAKELDFTVYLGLTANAAKFSNSGTFSMAIYSTSGYGFRGALQAYYALYPASFARRQTNECAYNYAGNETFNASTGKLTIGTNLFNSMSDFGGGLDFIAHMHGVAYDLYWTTNSVTRPTDAAVKAWMPTQSGGYLWAGSNAVAQLTTDAAGAIRYTASSYTAGTTQWYLEFCLNQDPELSTGLTGLLSPIVSSYFGTARAPFSSTVTSDFATAGGSTALDYNTNHIATADYPATFGKVTLAPAIVNELWDFYSAYLYPLSATNKFLIMGNSGDNDALFAAPFLDVGMIEGIRTAADYRLYRMLGYHKLWRNYTTVDTWSGVNYTEASFASEMMNCLALAIYPALSATVSGGMTETLRPYYQTYIPAISKLSAAGWEPVQYATATGGATVERFGSLSNGMHYSVANPTTNTVSSTVTIDETGLSKVGAVWKVRDTITGSSLAVTGASFPVALTNGQTRAFDVFASIPIHIGKVVAGRVTSR